MLWHRNIRRGAYRISIKVNLYWKIILCPLTCPVIVKTRIDLSRYAQRFGPYTRMLYAVQINHVFIRLP